MKCRCGHGREKHGYTSKGLAYARRERSRGRAYVAKQPCHGWHFEAYAYDLTLPIAGQEQRAAISGQRFVPCKCRNWHPEEASQ